MPGPIHARGDQRNGRRIDQMNRPRKSAGKSLPSFATDKPRREITQVLEDRPKEFLGHLRGPNFIGVGQVVAAGRSRPSQARQRTRMQAQRITQVIESDAVGQLRIQQGKDVAPGAEGPDFLFDPSLSRQFRNEKVGNEIAYLPQQIQLRASWNVLAVLNHPCRVAGLNKSFQLFRQFSMGWL